MMNNYRATITFTFSADDDNEAIKLLSRKRDDLAWCSRVMVFWAREDRANRLAPHICPSEQFEKIMESFQNSGFYPEDFPKLKPSSNDDYQKVNAKGDEQ